MFIHNLPEAKLYKKKADLFVRSATRVHLIQHPAENDVRPDDEDCGRREESCTTDETSRNHLVVTSIWQTPD